MKDYSLTAAEAESFILNYEVLGEQIKINYASHKSMLIPYSRVAEMELLNKMKEQVTNSDDFALLENTKIKSSRSYNIGYLASSFLNLIFVSPRYSNIGLIVSEFFAIIMGYNLYVCKKSRGKLDDLMKNKLFIMSENLVVEKYNTNPDFFVNISKKLVKYLKNLKYEGKELNLNTIDCLTLNDLIEILGNTYSLELLELLDTQLPEEFFKISNSEDYLSLLREKKSKNQENNEKEDR